MDKRIIAVDLDGTLAQYDGWKGIDHIGDVIPSVKAALIDAQREGAEVWIHTARVSDPDDAYEASQAIGKWLPETSIDVKGVTAIKMKYFTEFWDDRAIQVIKNQGVFVMDPNSIDKAPMAPVFLPDSAEEPRTPKSALDIQEGGNHYKKYKIQPIEFCFVNNIPVLEANAQKYILRHADKNGMGDLRKARHYLELMAEMYYGEKL